MMTFSIVDIERAQTASYSYVGGAGDGPVPELTCHKRPEKSSDLGAEACSMIPSGTQGFTTSNL